MAEQDPHAVGAVPQHVFRANATDPTPLTTAQILREISWLRELLEGRMTASDKAVALLQATMDKSPSVAELFAKHEEMFRGIDLQFRERDVRTDQLASQAKIAIDAALQAQKEAVAQQNESNSLAIAKSEASSIKQMDAINVLISASTKALDDKIGDLKDRLGTVEAKSVGKTEGLSMVGAIVLGAFAVIAVLVSVAALILSRTS